MTLLVSTHSANDLRGVADSIRREIAQIDARLPVFGMRLAEENMSLAYLGLRVSVGMATTFGLLALILATIGLYSVMAFAVSQQTREIGIRMALGAQVRDVLKLVVSKGMRMAMISIGLGLICAFVFTRVLARLLLGVGTMECGDLSPLYSSATCRRFSSGFERQVAQD